MAFALCAGVKTGIRRPRTSPRTLVLREVPAYKPLAAGTNRHASYQLKWPRIMRVLLCGVICLFAGVSIGGPAEIDRIRKRFGGRTLRIAEGSTAGSAPASAPTPKPRRRKMSSAARKRSRRRPGARGDPPWVAPPAPAGTTQEGRNHNTGN